MLRGIHAFRVENLKENTAHLDAILDVLAFVLFSTRALEGVMQTATQPDHFWRWHDAVGLPRPGRPGAAIRSNLRAQKKEMLGDGRLRFPPPSGADKARADLVAARKRLADIEKVRDAEWAEFCNGKRASPYGDLTLREWRKANTQVSYYEHTLIPLLDDIERHPFRRMPIVIPKPRDFWGHDEFEPNDPPVRKMREVPPALASCFWCKAAVPVPKITVEHIVPQWARPLSPALKAAQKNAPACYQCNQAKGPMPPALFASVRRNEHATRAHRVAWGIVAQKFSKWQDRQRFAKLIPEIEAEMLKPLVL